MDGPRLYAINRLDVCYLRLICNVKYRNFTSFYKAGMQLSQIKSISNKLVIRNVETISHIYVCW